MQTQEFSPKAPWTSMKKIEVTRHVHLQGSFSLYLDVVQQGSRKVSLSHVAWGLKLDAGTTFT
eukprot:scaffold9848_cov17-Tisochrysis_lutea.AAC.1